MTGKLWHFAVSLISLNFSHPFQFLKFSIIIIIIIKNNCRFPCGTDPSGCFLALVLLSRFSLISVCAPESSAQYSWKIYRLSWGLYRYGYFPLPNSCNASLTWAFMESEPSGFLPHITGMHCPMCGHGQWPFWRRSGISGVCCCCCTLFRMITESFRLEKVSEII